MRPLQEQQIEKQTAPFPSCCPAKTDYFRKHFLVFWDAAVSLIPSQPALPSHQQPPGHSEQSVSFSLTCKTCLRYSKQLTVPCLVNWPTYADILQSSNQTEFQTFYRQEYKCYLVMAAAIKLLFYSLLQRAADTALSPCLNTFLLRVPKVD